jgi:hypothetical protein
MGLNRNLRGPELTDALEALEAALAPFRMRPHWGKMSRFAVADYEREYGAALDDFRRVANELDPGGKFRNGWALAKIFGEEGAGRDYWLEEWLEEPVAASSEGR